MTKTTLILIALMALASNAERAPGGAPREIQSISRIA